MSVRGLIIAIEKYRLMTGAFAAELPGTHTAARSFWKWLVETKNAPPENVLVCTDDRDFPVDSLGASAGAIAATLGRLADAGRGSTSELYVFFSGHGFRFMDGFTDQGLDILVGGDFSNLRDSGRECLKLTNLQRDIKRWLGAGQHYYFVDACRNEVRATDVAPGELGIQRRAANNGQALVSTLYSTRAGSTASVASGFAEQLLAGLRGEGRAKSWWGPEMWVDFRNLNNFLKGRLLQEVPEASQEGEGKILKLEPTPKSTWTVTVEGAQPGDTFNLDVRNERLQRILLDEGPDTIQGALAEIEVAPGDYVLNLRHPTAKVEALDTGPADLYQAEWTTRFRKEPVVAEPDPAPLASDDSEAEISLPEPDKPTEPGDAPDAGSFGARGLESFVDSGDSVGDDLGSSRGLVGDLIGQALGGGGGFSADMQAALRVEYRDLALAEASLEGHKATLELTLAPGQRLRVRNLQSGELEFDRVLDIGGMEPVTVLPGTYLVDSRTPDGTVTARHEVTLEAGDCVDFDLRHSPALSRRPVARILRQRFGLDDGRIDFSERLGPMVGEDLGVWMSILGASRIVDNPLGFSKMGPMPMATFEDVEEGGSAAYVLIALTKARSRVRLGISQGAEVAWKTAKRVGNIPGFFHGRLEGAPGPWLLHGRAGSRPVISLASRLLPNHVTLVVVTDAEDTLRIHQHILPVHHRFESLPTGLQEGRWRNVLEAVRFGAVAQRQFARNQPMAPDDGSGPWAELWQALHDGTWRDPVVATLAAYQRLRNGQVGETHGLLAMLQQHYPELADTAVLSHLTLDDPGPVDPATLEGLPLVNDGLFSLDLSKMELPLPESHLDASTPWTVWLGGVPKG